MILSTILRPLFQFSRQDKKSLLPVAQPTESERRGSPARLVCHGASAEVAVYDFTSVYAGALSPQDNGKPLSNYSEALRDFWRQKRTRCG